MANTQVSDRMDLNQFVLSMVSKQHGISHSIQAHPVNSSDKKTILQAIQRVKESIDFEDDGYFVDDSAIYSEENLILRNYTIELIAGKTFSTKNAKRLIGEIL